MGWTCRRVLPIVNTVGQGVVAFHWAPSPSSNLLLVLLRSYLDNTRMPLPPLPPGRAPLRLGPILLI